MFAASGTAAAGSNADTAEVVQLLRPALDAAQPARDGNRILVAFVVDQLSSAQLAQLAGAYETSLQSPDGAAVATERLADRVHRAASSMAMGHVAVGAVQHALRAVASEAETYDARVDAGTIDGAAPSVSETLPLLGKAPRPTRPAVVVLHVVRGKRSYRDLGSAIVRIADAYEKRFGDGFSALLVGAKQPDGPRARPPRGASAGAAAAPAPPSTSTTWYWFTYEIGMGLAVGLVLLIILAVGIHALMSLKTPVRCATDAASCAGAVPH